MTPQEIRAAALAASARLNEGRPGTDAIDVLVDARRFERYISGEEDG